MFRRFGVIGSSKRPGTDESVQESFPSTRALFEKISEDLDENTMQLVDERPSQKLPYDIYKEFLREIGDIKRLKQEILEIKKAYQIVLYGTMTKRNGELKVLQLDNLLTLTNKAKRSGFDTVSEKVKEIFLEKIDALKVIIISTATERSDNLYIDKAKKLDTKTATDLIEEAEALHLGSDLDIKALRKLQKTFLSLEKKALKAFFVENPISIRGKYISIKGKSTSLSFLEPKLDNITSKIDVALTEIDAALSVLYKKLGVVAIIRSQFDPDSVGTITDVFEILTRINFSKLDESVNRALFLNLQKTTEGIENLGDKQLKKLAKDIFPYFVQMDLSFIPDVINILPFAKLQRCWIDNPPDISSTMENAPFFKWQIGQWSPCDFRENPNLWKFGFKVLTTWGKGRLSDKDEKKLLSFINYSNVEYSSSEKRDESKIWDEAVIKLSQNICSSSRSVSPKLKKALSYLSSCVQLANAKSEQDDGKKYLVSIKKILSEGNKEDFELYRKLEMILTPIECLNICEADNSKINVRLVHNILFQLKKYLNSISGPLGEGEVLAIEKLLNKIGEIQQQTYEELDQAIKSRESFYQKESKIVAARKILSQFDQETYKFAIEKYLESKVSLSDEDAYLALVTFHETSKSEKEANYIAHLDRVSQNSKLFEKLRSIFSSKSKDPTLLTDRLKPIIRKFIEQSKGVGISVSSLESGEIKLSMSINGLLGNEQFERLMSVFSFTEQIQILLANKEKSFVKTYVQSHAEAFRNKLLYDIQEDDTRSLILLLLNFDLIDPFQLLELKKKYDSKEDNYSSALKESMKRILSQNREIQNSVQMTIYCIIASSLELETPFPELISTLSIDQWSQVKTKLKLKLPRENTGRMIKAFVDKYKAESPEDFYQFALELARTSEDITSDFTWFSVIENTYIAEALTKPSVVAKVFADDDEGYKEFKRIQGSIFSTYLGNKYALLYKAFFNAGGIDDHHYNRWILEKILSGSPIFSNGRVEKAFQDVESVAKVFQKDVEGNGDLYYGKFSREMGKLPESSRTRILNKVLKSDSLELASGLLAHYTKYSEEFFPEILASGVRKFKIEWDRRKSLDKNFWSDPKCFELIESILRYEVPLDDESDEESVILNFIQELMTSIGDIDFTENQLSLLFKLAKSEYINIEKYPDRYRTFMKHLPLAHGMLRKHINDPRSHFLALNFCGYVAEQVVDEAENAREGEEIDTIFLPEGWSQKTKQKALKTFLKFKDAHKNFKVEAVLHRQHKKAWANNWLTKRFYAVMKFFGKWSGSYELGKKQIKKAQERNDDQAKRQLASYGKQLSIFLTGNEVVGVGEGQESESETSYSSSSSSHYKFFDDDGCSSKTVKRERRRSDSFSSILSVGETS